MELVLITPQSQAWEEMWQWLEAHPINEGLEQPSVALHEGEAWQYMGTYKNGDKAVSSFRHRNHPRTGAVYNVSYSHDNLREDQITKKFKV